MTAQTNSTRILIGNDQPDVLEALRLLTKGAGCQPVTVDSPRAVLNAVGTSAFDLILIDLNYARDTTSGQEGLDLLSTLQAQQIQTPVVVMTAWGSIDLAVQAMRLGAVDFVQKPWDNSRVLEIIRQQTRERPRSELELACHVQRRLLPIKAASRSSLECAALCCPAGSVSGDYYDFIELPSGKLGLLLADVSGKGMAAALLMANLQASIRSECELSRESPQLRLEAVNRRFFMSTRPEHYATLFYGEFDDATRQLTYVNCGHVSPLMLRSAGAIERLQSTATVLGMFPAWTCQTETIPLEPGDIVVAFSDGIVEAGLENGTEFGEEGVLHAAAIRPDLGLTDRMHWILERAVAHCNGIRADDMTIVAARCV